MNQMTRIGHVCVDELDGVDTDEYYFRSCRGEGGLQGKGYHSWPHEYDVLPGVGPLYDQSGANWEFSMNNGRGGCGCNRGGPEE